MSLNRLQEINRTFSANKQKRMTEHSSKITIGISSCLLGHEVRYDSGHKLNRYIQNTLGQYFTFVPFCPEVESGMTIPRPPIHLRQTARGIRCVGVKDHHYDVTDQLNICASKQRHWLENLSGYIFKKNSPSCGMERVKIYKNDYPNPIGTGVFAQFVKDNFPLLPMEEEHRLGDSQLRENFFQRVCVMKRWKQLNLMDINPHQLTVFHAQHKLIAMSHDQNDARALGKLIAGANKGNITEIIEQYGLDLMVCLKKTASRGNHVNVLQHIQGYLKTKLDSGDKVELVETIERYRLGLLPLIVPITLLKHHFRKTPDPFISESFYMSPYPAELTVLNEI